MTLASPLNDRLSSARQRLDAMIQNARQLPPMHRDLVEKTVGEFSGVLDTLQALSEELGSRELAFGESALALEAEKQRQRKLLDLSPNAHLVTNHEGLIWEANSEAASLLGTPAASLIRKSLVDWVDETDRAVFIARLAQLQSRRLNQFTDWPVRLKASQSAAAWIAIDVSSVQDQRNELVGLRWLLRDISLQKLIEDALRKSEERYRRLLSSVTDYVYTVEVRNNRPVSTSHGLGCEAVTGYTAEEYAADPQLWLRMVCKEDQKAVLRQARHALKGDAQPFEHRILHKDGSIRWVRNTPVPRYNDQGRLTAYDGLITDITARVEAEQAMRRTSQQFQELVQSLDGIIWEADLPSITFLYVSPQAERILGYPIQQWLDEPHFWQNHILEEDRQRVIHYGASQINAGSDHSLEYRMVAADGRVIWLRDVVSVIRDQGKPIKLRGVMLDITHQKQAEQELRESEEKYRTLFEASTDAILVETFDDKILDCNASTIELFGYTKEELLQLSIQDLVPREIGQNLELLNQQLMEQGHVSLEAFNIRKNGEVFPCVVNIVTTSIGGQPRVITYVRDITKRKQAEQALQQAQAELEQRVLERTAELQVTVEMLELEVEERQRAKQALAESQRFLQLVLDCLPTPVFYKDTQGRFLGCNQAYEKFIGSPRSAIIGHTLADLAPADLAAENMVADEALFRDLKEQVYESTTISTDGQRHHIVLNKAPFFHPDGSLGGLVGSVFDITERKRMEAYMMRTERLAAMGSIAATLAHEIKNPLQTIQSNVELVLDFDLDPEEHDEYLRLCYHEIQRLIEITSRLLNLALPRREALQPTSIPEQIQHVLALVAHSLEKAQVQVTTQVSPDLGEEVIPEQVIEVLLNLLVNAVEALPNGGEIYITAWPEGKQARIAVKNSGSQIAEEYLERIFEPFFTTKPLGSGLGLPISYHIIEQLGGNLVAENLPDGVQFIISLPLAASYPASDPPDELDTD